MAPLAACLTLNDTREEGSDVIAVDTQHRLIYSTEDMAEVTDDTEIIGGYALVEDLSWTIIAQNHADTLLAPVAAHRQRAILVSALDPDVRARPAGSRELVVLGESCNAMFDGSRQLITQVKTAGVEVSSAAAELSASSDELAATTTQQSAAFTQVAATTKELARSSASIAETVGNVAWQTAETWDNLEQAEGDISTSSERTLALARRVNDIDALLDLINDIADQTNEDDPSVPAGRL
jgi:methyl-accepting chemotaxis protein